MDVLAMDDDFLEMSSGDMRDMWDTSNLLETVSTRPYGPNTRPPPVLSVQCLLRPGEPGAVT